MRNYNKTIPQKKNHSNLFPSMRFVIPYWTSSFVFTWIILLNVHPSVFGQSGESAGRFRPVYIDSSGALIDSLPTFEDSIFVDGKEYKFTGLDENGKTTGLHVFDEATLNLSLKVGEEEDRELGFFAKAGSWLINNVTRIASLTFVKPEIGANRFFFVNEILTEDLRLIRSLYEQQGYFGAKIVLYKATMSKDRRKISLKIYIHEGKPTVLSEDPKIKVISSLPLVDPRNDLDPKKIIDQLIVQKGDVLARESIDLDKATVQKIFGQHGYFSAEVTELIDTVGMEPLKVKVEYTVLPGRYTVFGKTDVAGNYYKSQNANVPVDTTHRIVNDEVILLKVRYKEGRPFDPDKLGLSVGQINGLSVFRSVKPLMSKKRGQVDSALIASKSDLSVMLDSIKQKSDNRLMGKDVNVHEFGIPVDTLNITMSVNERKEKIIKPGVGITTDFRDLPASEQRGLSNLPFLGLQVTWQSRNFMGGARKLEVSAKVSKGFVKDRFFANYMQGKIAFRQPSFILPFTRDAENDLLLTISAERNNTKAFDELSYEVSPTFIRQLTRQLSMNLTPLAFTRKRILRTEASDNTDRNFFTTNSRLGFTFNSSNDFFYPNTGFLIYATGDFAGFLLPSDLKYIKWNFDNRKYFGVTKKMSLALRAHVGSDIPYYVGTTKTQIPVSEQFYGGGPNSIRGWGIKELGVIEEKLDTAGDGKVSSRLTYLGGNSILEASIELRYNLYVSRNPNDAISGMDIAGFVDYGHVWTEYNFKNFDKALPIQPVGAAGIGTRIRTLIGPVRIDVGYKLVNIDKIKVRDVKTQQIRTISSVGAKKNVSPIAFQITLGQPF